MATANPYVNIIIWVISSSEKNNDYYYKSCYWLHRICYYLKNNIPLLILCTKNDLDGAKTPYELTKLLNLSSCKRKYFNYILDGI